MRVVIRELADLEGPAQGEDHGVDQLAVGPRRIDQALRDGGTVKGIALFDVQIGGIALRLGELVD